MIPYTSEDYSLDFCKELAKELRESGKFTRVVVRKKDKAMTLTTYKIMIVAVPFPFQGIASATTLKAAIAKVVHQAKKCGVKHPKAQLIGEPEIMGRREI